MKIITMSEEMGLIYYTAKDYKYDDIFVIVYGLQVKNSMTAKSHNKNLGIV